MNSSCRCFRCILRQQSFFCNKQIENRTAQNHITRSFHALSCIFQQAGSPAICIGCYRYVTQACCVLGWSTVQKQALLPDSPAWCWCCLFITLLSFNSRLSPRSPWPQPCIQKPSLLPACLPRGSNLTPALDRIQMKPRWSSPSFAARCQHACWHMPGGPFYSPRHDLYEGIGVISGTYQPCWRAWI